MLWNKIVTYVFHRLTKHNVLFVKLFQALSSNNFVSKETLEIFKSFTNSAKFYENEVDYELLDKVVEKYKIQLYSTAPINAGMISIVFKGRMEDTDVIIKMKRIDIYNRLQWGYKEFGYFYKIAFWILWLFGKNDLLDTIASFVESEDYILTQCEFKDEIFAMRTMKKELDEYIEIGTITHIDKIVIPRVYNQLDETEYIVMDFLDGISCFEVSEQDKNEYIYIMGVFTTFPLISTVQHTDLHPGNMIFMNVNGVKKIGVIDFGMFVTNTKKIQSALLGLTDLYVKQRDASHNYYKYVNQFLEPMLDERLLTKEQLHTLNLNSIELITDMIEGRLTENNMRRIFKNMCSVVPEMNPKFDIELIKILLGNTMACATLFSLTQDIELVGSYQKRIFKEVVS